jgi:glycosyltransferase involved in cell wall biosynthesis
MALDGIFDFPRIGRRRRKEEVVTLADRARDARQWRLAAELYRETLDRNPRNAPIWVQYGHALKEWGDLREPGKLAQAETAYRRALSLDPAEADTYLQLGHVLKLQGKTEDAKAAYLRAFALDPSAPYPKEFSGLGWSEVHAGELKRLVASDTRSHSSIKLHGVRGDTARGNVQKFPATTQSLLPIPAATLSVPATETVELNSFPAETTPLAIDRMEQEIRIIRESGLFDQAFYRANNRDLLDEVDLVRHFVARGAREGCMPNRMFDPRYYFFENPDVIKSGDNPLVHFIRHGASEGRRPHRNFDPAFYLRKYPDVAHSGDNPLLHFLLHGEQEGRKRNADEAKVGDATAVTDAQIHCLKQPSFSDEVALFVTHSPNGGLKPHVPHYLQSLRLHGIAVVLIIATERPFTATDETLLNQADGVFIRWNEGYDFAAWAHVLLLHPELFDSTILYLINDSVIGPTNDVAFEELLGRLRKNSADLVGLTESFDRNWHIQSYFLALKRRALSSVALLRFIEGIVAYKDKEDVINHFEIRLAPVLESAGLVCERMFSTPRDFSDPTIYHWKMLLQAGFPFIKVKIIRDSFAGVDSRDWREVLAQQGYDVSLAQGTLAGETAFSWASNLSAPKQKVQPFLPQVSSSIEVRETRIAFVGPWNYDNGLGVASRGYISALRHTGLHVNLHPIRTSFHIHQQIAPAVDLCDFSGSADIAIVHLNPDGWPSLLTDRQVAIIGRAKMRVGLWVWEMAQIPKNWYPAFDLVDAIWAPSRYCADIFSGKAQGRVDVIPHVVAVDPSPPEPVRSAALRQELGMPANDRIILYAFDGSSYLVRKNPFALVHSFVRSRLGEKGWRLVLKTKHLFDSPEQGKALQQEVDRAHGVMLIDRGVDKATMRGLMRVADIFASPHCSEGFGLTIAEAMAMGKIVIATDYAGSRDFLDAECGFPIRYRLGSLDRDHGHYTRDGGVWAQIDETHLTEALIEASELVKAGDTRLGEAARNRINDLCSPAAIGAKMRSSTCCLLSAY